MGMLAWHQGDFRQTQIFGEQFLEAARTLGDASMTIRALSLLGMRAALQGDYVDAHTCYNESLALAQSIGYDMGVAVAHQLMGYLAVYEGDCVQAVALFTTALTMVRKLGNEPRINWILGGLGEAYYYQKDYPQAHAWFAEQLAFGRGLAEEDQLAHGFALYGLGLVALAQQQEDSALEYLTESLVVRRANGDQYGALQCLEALARLHLGQKQAARAIRLLGFTTGRRMALGTPYHPVEQPAIEQMIATAQAQLDITSYAIEYAAGQALSLDQAVACG
jgi:tetratricopeptide (TPR) repeat protein